jgi:hypothetical protein
MTVIQHLSFNTRRWNNHVMQRSGVADLPLHGEFGHAFGKPLRHAAALAGNHDVRDGRAQARSRVTGR